MRLFTEAMRVARLESSLFRRFPKLRGSVAGIALIPALYAFIYLESVWDPASRTAELPAKIVNLDRGTELNGQRVAIGADLARTLKDKHAFGFADEPDADAARREVREGRALFALIIPPDFSASAMAARGPGAGKLVVYASEGNNYAGAGFAKRFGSELGHQINETLNEKRWAAVLGTASSSQDSLARLRDGVAKLREGSATLRDGTGQARHGAAQLATGAGQLAGGVTTLADGVKQLGAGARQLDAKKPAAADLQALKAGATQLATGSAELATGLPKLEEGAGRLAEGAGQLRDQSKGIPLVGGKVAGGAGQLADGAGQLRAGLHTATEGQAKLAAGAQSLSHGVAQLADGFAAYAGGASLLASKFPPDAKLDELSAGGTKLASASGELATGLGKLQGGAQQLAAGLVTLEEALPANIAALPGTARGLANSVEPEMQIDAPVANNGLGFAPNFIPVSLWLGAVMTAFIFHLRRLPAGAADAPRASLLLGKMTVLGSINAVQVAFVLGMAALVLGLHPVHFFGLAVTMLASALTFMLVILALVRLFGDAGKAVALILLILQLSSAGGVVPIELTNGFYRAVSPWLPFTWAVKAVRASAFGAFGSDWASAVGVIVLFGLGAFVVSMFVGRWKFVGEDEHRPAMDI